MPKLAGLWIYPVKSLAGISLNSAIVEERGLQFDRRWMVVDEHGRFLTQRQLPTMARLKTALSDSLEITRDDGRGLSIPFQTDGPNVTVQVWKDELLAVDCGEAASQLLSEALDKSCRLVRMPPDSRRVVDSTYTSQETVTSFSDGFPFLVIGDGSLAALNDRLIEKGAEPLEIERFRPNFLVSGVEAFQEDSWGKFQIGEVQFEAVKPCSRCVITTLDPSTGISMGAEPLLTLGQFRRGQNGVYFGQNLVAYNNGPVQLGDEVKVGQFRPLSCLLSF